MIGRRGAAYGAIGSHSGSEAHYYTTNTLHLEEVSMRVNRQNHFYPIIKHGNWVVKKLDFKIDDTVTMRISIDGSGIGYAYASYLDEDGNTQLLFIKKVQHGIYEDSFVVPDNVLKNVKVGISTTVPKGAKIDYLSNKDKHAIKRNALLISQSVPISETTGLGGFSDLGAMYNINQTPTGGRYGKYALWNGDLSSHSWTTHGYTGQKQNDKYAGEGPVMQVEKTAYYTSRHSFYLAKFTPDGQFMGWQAITGNFLQQSIPAGVPICMVQQHYYLTEYSSTGYGDAEMNPKWRYMKNMKTVASLFFADHDYFERTYNPSKKQAAGRKHGSDDGVIYGTPKPGLNYSKKDKDGNWVVDNAVKLEWLDPDTNAFTDLRATPGFYPSSNSKGKSMWIFRFPRQLDPIDDKKRVDELNSYGINYSLDRTKDAYPRMNRAGELKYTLVGRPKPDGIDEYQWKENGKTYQAFNSFNADCYIRYDGKASAGDSPYDRYERLPIGISISDGEKLAKYNYPELFNTYYAAGEFNAGNTIFAIGKGLGGGSECVITKNKDDHRGDIDQKYYVNNVEKVADGSMIGTRDGDILFATGIIDSDEISEGDLANHPDLDATWKKVFGAPLTAEFFTSDVAKAFLEDQDPDNPLHYLQTDPDTNDTYSFPYQIIWFKIPMDYYGPYVDYEPFEEEKDGMVITTMKIVAPENKPYAVKGTNDPIYLNITSGFRKFSSQKFELVDEITEQRELEAAGLDPESIIMANQTNFESEDVTAEESQQQVEQLYLARTNTDTGSSDGSSDGPAKKKNKGDKYVKSWWEARFNFGKPKDFVYESQLKEEGLLGFTNERNFFVEDVTQKWGDLNGMHLPEGSYSTEMMPESNPESPFDPMLGLGALGAFDDLGNVLEDIGVVDSEEENWEDVQRDAGYLLEATANAGVEVARGMWNVGNGDLSKARKRFANVDDYLLDANPDDDSVITISANMVRNSGVASAQSAVSVVDDLIGDLAGGPRYSVSNGGLGEISADDIEGYGEKTAAFGKGVVKRLLPESLIDAYDKNPVLYSAVLGGFVLFGIPVIGPTIARTIGQSGSQVIKTVAQAPGAIISGSVEGGKMAASSIVGNRKSKKKKASRGSSAARRRRSY